MAAGCLNGLPHGAMLVDREVIEHHHLILLEAGDQDALEVELEGGTISAPVNQHGGLHALGSQRCEQGQVLSIVPGHDAGTAFTSGCTTVAGHKRDVGPTLVDEDVAASIEFGHDPVPDR